MKLIRTGKLANIYKLNQLVLKILHENQVNEVNSLKIQQECHLLNTLKETNIPIPKNVKEIINESGIVCGIQYQYINGTEFEKFQFTNQTRKNFNQSLLTFFKQIKKINTFDKNIMNKKRIDISKEIYTKIIERNEQNFSLKKLNQIQKNINQFTQQDINNNIEISLVHGDINNKNILVNKNGFISGIIDWTEHMYSDTAYDLAGVLIYFGTGSLNHILNYMSYSEEMNERINYYASMEYLFH
jgi:aminoglycoside phosphotransferase (APT) family kinase protein|tara:strand:+ start:440 stop:1168 length:729 start_codon:yes stop_codon:yes gene_type:complete